ncbi:uncharacterized protein VTP21DRAFT_4125 [Calcarisporiella thermophila]|uniref:uncharacterized protein n=1 Tax=Calcarisporiella thermophila TaxID=911321 RepID=UPI00374359FC
MSLSQWRQFNFFDTELVTDGFDTPESFPVFQKADITATTSGRGHIIVSDSSGCIHIIDRTFSVLSFQAFDGGRVTHLKQMKQSNILVAIGEESAVSSHPIVKVWDLDRQEKGKNTPLCVRTIRLQHDSKPYPASCLAILENMSQMAVGMANGSVIIIRGDISRDRTVKQKVIYDGNEPVTGLGYREQHKSTTLFIVTTSRIYTYNSSGKGHLQLLDEHGCGLGCAVLTDMAQEMVIGRDEAIYFYGPDGRGPCFAFEAPKSSLTCFKNYLIIVSPPIYSAQKLDASTRKALSLSPPPSTTNSYDTTTVTIFDTQNKFIALTHEFPQGVRAVVCEWGYVYVITCDGKLYALEEKDTPTKLDILLKKNLYLLAINLARSQKYDDTGIADIFKKYGDHLYSKGDYEGAMQQYIRTIGKLEPSYVIRKFLDAQRLYSLTSYLQELHSQGLANEDHTTLLLNCYTKLKDVTKLDQFIKSSSELNFDLETAIKVLRQAGYYEHALYLSEKYTQHDLYLQIQIEHIKDYDKALKYIRQLKSLEADHNLQKYGKVLLKHQPEETTSLLIDLCTGVLHSAASASYHSFQSHGPSPPTSHSFSISLPFSHRPSILRTDSSGSLGAPPAPAPPPPVRTSTLDTRPPPQPTRFMSLFVEQPEYLIKFLEETVRRRWEEVEKAPRNEGPERVLVDKTVSESHIAEQEEKEKRAVWNTLLELYLMDDTANPSIALDNSSEPRQSSSRRVERREKALRLLVDSNVNYDINQALIMCHLARFDAGVVYLLEREEKYADILRFWMEREKPELVIEGLRKYGQKDPSLYPLALSYLSSTPSTLDAADLHQVLTHINKHNLLPPLQIVQALSQSSVATVGMVKDFLGSKIEEERRRCDEDTKLIQSYRAETEKKRREIEELRREARVFQVTKCSGCGGQLDLPSVHFLCRHSFHQRCLNDGGEKICPQCAVEQRMVGEIRAAQERNAQRHDLFFAQMEDTDDGFSVIADYFSKNSFMFARLID